MSGALRSCKQHDDFLSCSQQDYNDPELREISRYYFPGKIHDIISIVTHKRIRISDPDKEAPALLCNGFCWQHHHGIFTGVDFTYFNLYYYSNC